LSCTVHLWNEQVIGVQLPMQHVYTVLETPPNFKGNTIQNALKPAVLDSGATVHVPGFIEVGEKILVSVAEKKYLSRANPHSF
jgi:elongation factor P